MSLLEGYFAGAHDLRIIRRDARDKVMWAAPEIPGELVKQRVYRAYVELRTLTYSVVKDAWYEQLGPYQYPAVHNAWLALCHRRALQSNASPELQLYINERPIEPVTRAQIDLAKAIAGLRKAG